MPLARINAMLSQHRLSSCFSRVCLVGLLCQPLAPAWAQSAHYRLDPVHTRVAVTISHAGFSDALGTLSGSEGTLVFDPDDWPRAQMEITVPLTRLDFGDADWNKAVQAGNLLDVKAYPNARFISTRIETIDTQHFIAHGLLMLHGTSREIALDVHFNQLKRHPLPPFRRTAGFSAVTSFSRAAFGIDAWKSVIGDTVTLRIEAEAIRSSSKAEQDPPDATPVLNVQPPIDSTVTAEDLDRRPVETATDAADKSTHQHPATQEHNPSPEPGPWP